MVLVHVHRFHRPTNKTTHVQSAQTKPTVHTQSTQTTSTVPRAIYPNETVGAVPMCPPERPRSGVSIQKIHALCVGGRMMDAPLWSDTGGHTGIAPTHLHHIFPHIPHKQKNHLHAIRPKETNRPYQSPLNHAVCHYPLYIR